MGSHFARVGTVTPACTLVLEADSPSWRASRINPGNTLLLGGRLQLKERRLTDLRAKQGRSARFKSQAERDSFLKKEIKDIEKSLAEKRSQARTLVVALLCRLCWVFYLLVLIYFD